METFRMTITLGTEVLIGSNDTLFGRLGSDPSSVTLTDGRVAVVWSEFNFGGDVAGFDMDTYVRILNADGSEATASVLVQSDSTGALSLPNIAALSDGGFMVSWQKTLVTNGEREDDIYVRSFTSSATPRNDQTFASPDFVVPEGQDASTYNNNGDNTILGLAGGGAVVVWTHRGTDTTYARTVANDGVTMGDPVKVFDTKHIPNQIIQLTNGDLLMARYDGNYAGVALRISGADLTSAPASIAGATEPVFFSHDPVEGDAIMLVKQQIAALPDGGYAISYLMDPNLKDSDEEYLVVDRFDATGTLTGSGKVVLADDDYYRPDTNLIALPDGRTLVAWNKVIGYGDTDVVVQIFGTDGTPEGESQVFSTTTSGAQLVGGASVLSNGNVMLTFTDSSNVALDGTIDPLHARILEIEAGPVQAITKTGTSADELLLGGAGDDNLNGAGGNDTLQGMDGADTLIGGDGDDFIYGGSTAADLRDVVYGGNGNDYVEGGYGNDELRGDAGNDTLAGGYGADTMIGGAGDDEVTGSAWGDVLFGGDGNDFINGGFGYDRVNGGTGADQFFHTGNAGHGSDWIQDYSAAEGDVLFYGAAATKDDFLIQRATTPQAGADGVQEVFITHKTTGVLLWALVDGDAQTELNVKAAGTTFDLLG
jgi:Ca2+-binding RTX toxin-like protein